MDTAAAPRSSITKLRLKAGLKKVPGLAQLARLYKFVTVPAYRSEWRLMRANPDNLFQPYSQTSLNRYPRFFSYVREHVQDDLATRILSFGCSIGEEVFSLRRYFSQAEIVGIDINPHNIAICNKKMAQLPDEHIHFKLAGSTQAEPAASYDVVFCMAVLRHGKLSATGAKTCDHLIRFEDFEKMVCDFCRVLKPGGYLLIRHSNFRLMDTHVAAQFDTVYSVNPTESPAETPLYDRNNRLLVDAVYNDVIFRKR